MKLATYFALHREEMKRGRRAITVALAVSFALRALFNGAALLPTLSMCLVIAIGIYAVLFCIDRIIGIIWPISIDLTKVKGVEVYYNGDSLIIENEQFLIKATDEEGGHIDSFKLFEKAASSKARLESNYTAYTGENCLLLDGNNQYKLDAGLARHLLVILSCHAEAVHACRGLSFIA